MISYTKRNINFLSLIITIAIFVSTQYIQYILSNNNFKFSILNPFYINSIQVKMQESNRTEEIKDNTKKAEESSVQSDGKEKTKEIWQIKISKIDLETQIAEGTEEVVLENYVGHFSETSKTQGNIGLAAHNRGYKNNYFSRLKELREGDEIYYQYKEFVKTYVVKEHKIIQDTDWTSLENTKENTLTLITCVENQPEFRRCIQAIEKKG